MNFLEELHWRGLYKDSTPGIEEKLESEMVTGYVGYDPTASSLQIGNLVTIMLLMHLQRHGHKPVALVGGATAMVGDPSGKSEERNLMSVEQIRENAEKFKKQLGQFLDFENGDNKAEMVNNYDWFGKFDLMTFLRDIGKHVTVNYMVAKDSVKSRMGSEQGISFTEFSYQLIQGYDFCHLYQDMNCTLQMGGSDQWGNITTGTELVRRIAGGSAFGITCPLITKADGTKFGKTEGGTIWLDPEETSPYQFFQFWMNSSDEDAERYIKIFTLKSKEEIEGIIASHKENPGFRELQKALAEDVTLRVHGQKGLDQAETATRVLFGKKSKKADLEAIDPQDFKSMTMGVPSGEVSLDAIKSGEMGILDFMVQAGATASNGEGRQLLKGGGLKINKETQNDMKKTMSEEDLLHGSSILIQKGKKNYHIVFVK